MRFWFETHTQLGQQVLKLESDLKRMESLAKLHYDNWIHQKNCLDNTKDRLQIQISELLQEIKKRDKDIIDLKDLVIAKGLVIDKLRSDKNA